MSIVCDWTFVDDLQALIRTANKVLKQYVVIPKPSARAFGTTITLEETDMSIMKYNQVLGPLPEKSGNDKDLVGVMFRVDVDGVEGTPVEVTDFDLDTRAYTGSGVPWEAKKGAAVVLAIAERDDDDNIGDYATFDFGKAKDTIRPDAATPESLGSTTVVDEVPDA